MDEKMCMNWLEVLLGLVFNRSEEQCCSGAVFYEPLRQSLINLLCEHWVSI